MNNRNLLINFLNYCQEKRQMPIIDDDNTHLVDDYFRNLQQCNVNGTLLPDKTDKVQQIVNKAMLETGLSENEVIGYMIYLLKGEEIRKFNDNYICLDVKV